MLIIQAVVGLAILLFGRQLFWVFVAGVGYVLGILYAAPYYQGQPPWVLILIGAVAGIVGALFAYALQRFAAIVAGFSGGYYLGLILGVTIGWDSGLLGTLLPVFTGILGVLFLLITFDWSLIFMSGLAGSTIIVQATNYNQQTTIILFIALLILSVVVQAFLYYQDQELE